MKEFTLERNGIKLYSRPYNGRAVMVVQYTDDNPGMDNDDPERRPIYVGFHGHEGRPLDEVLLELDAYKQALGDPSVLKILSKLTEQTQYLGSRLTDLEERVANLTTRRRRWWRR